MPKYWVGGRGEHTSVRWPKPSLGKLEPQLQNVVAPIVTRSQNCRGTDRYSTGNVPSRSGRGPLASRREQLGPGAALVRRTSSKVSLNHACMKPSHWLKHRIPERPKARSPKFNLCRANE